jgi:hypothetical protein
MSTFVTPAQSPTAPPRGALWAASFAAWIARVLSRRSTVRPPSAPTRTQAAAAVREYAMQVARHDPRYAADLIAAADRHERLGE